MIITDYAEALRSAQDIEDLTDLCHRHVGAPTADSVRGVEQQNALRGLLAASGLVVYVRRCRTTNEEFELQIADLVGDLRHLADSLKVSWDEVERRVESNYRAEMSGG
ncbi:hypothetical protein [Rhodococcus pyridinivorans]|uniref:hypothetical protein n=1 Tax=Rhodococcus pyridinivorans TaxID=103816 RepID=UPI002658F5D3|nr:hypothetical protein [Rhodococcus pyridinivorans]